MEKHEIAEAVTEGIERYFEKYEINPLELHEAISWWRDFKDNMKIARRAGITTMVGTVLVFIVKLLLVKIF